MKHKIISILGFFTLSLTTSSYALSTDWDARELLKGEQRYVCPLSNNGAYYQNAWLYSYSNRLAIKANNMKEANEKMENYFLKTENLAFTFPGYQYCEEEQAYLKRREEYRASKARDKERYKLPIEVKIKDKN